MDASGAQSSGDGTLCMSKKKFSLDSICSRLKIGLEDQVSQEDIGKISIDFRVCDEREHRQAKGYSLNHGVCDANLVRCEAAGQKEASSLDVNRNDRDPPNSCGWYHGMDESVDNALAVVSIGSDFVKPDRRSWRTDSAQIYGVRSLNCHVADVAHAISNDQVDVPVAKAAARLDIPKTAIKRCLHDASADSEDGGFMLSALDELELVNFVLQQAERKVSERALCSDVLEQAERLNKISSSWSDGECCLRCCAPTNAWLRRFVSRHRDLHSFFPSFLRKSDDIRASTFSSPGLCPSICGQDDLDPKRKQLTAKRARKRNLDIDAEPVGKSVISDAASCAFPHPNSLECNSTPLSPPDGEQPLENYQDFSKTKQVVLCSIDKLLSSKSSMQRVTSQDISFDGSTSSILNVVSDVSRSKHESNFQRFMLFLESRKRYAEKVCSDQQERVLDHPAARLPEMKADSRIACGGLLSTVDDSKRRKSFSKADELSGPYKNFLRQLCKSADKETTASILAECESVPCNRAAAPGQSPNSHFSDLNKPIISEASSITAPSLSSPLIDPNNHLAMFEQSVSRQTATDSHDGTCACTNAGRTNQVSPIKDGKSELLNLSAATVLRSLNLQSTSNRGCSLVGACHSQICCGSVTFTSVPSSSNSGRLLTPVLPEIGDNHVLSECLHALESALGPEHVQLFSERYQRDKKLERLYSKWVMLRSDLDFMSTN